MHKVLHHPDHLADPGQPLVRLKLRRGHFLDNPPDDAYAVHLERMRAALPSMGPTSYFARSSAALIHGLPVFSADLDRVHRVHTDGGHGQRTGVSHTPTRHR